MRAKKWLARSFPSCDDMKAMETRAIGERIWEQELVLLSKTKKVTER